MADRVVEKHATVLLLRAAIELLRDADRDLLFLQRAEDVLVAVQQREPPLPYGQSSGACVCLMWKSMVTFLLSVTRRRGR